MIDLEQLIEESHRLPQPIGDTFMTIATQLEARGEARGEVRGEAKGRIEGKIETARNLLQEGADPQFVAKVTGLPIADVQRLQNHAE